jgi:hypothetical protein
MAEPDNLILSILREMRSEAAAFRSETTARFDAIDRRFDAVEARLDAVETKTDGIAVLLASAFGHLSHEMTALSARVDALEPAKR